VGLLLIGFGASPAGADDKPAAAEPPARVETRHTINLAGHPVDYRAIAETIGLTDTKGEPTASIYTVSYIAEAPLNTNAANTNAAGQRRPVAFVFNGGPGAASVFLHLGALGPRILDTPATGAVPAPPFRLADNPSSWLAFTDLVFVDPVGTGFSHGKGKEDNPDKPFWNVHGDLNSLGALLRRWLSRHERWSSPVFLVGESYGGLRAAALARTLARDVGITVNGLVLVSPALDIAILHPDISNPLAPAFELPSLAAATAGLSGRNGEGEDSAAVEKFALSDYLVGLAAQKGVPAPGDPFIARIARMIGLPEEIVRRERGRSRRCSALTTPRSPARPWRTPGTTTPATRCSAPRSPLLPPPSTPMPRKRSATAPSCRIGCWRMTCRSNGIGRPREAGRAGSGSRCRRCRTRCSAIPKPGS
jgi:carboxypeptidase C (cathepsin A)